MSTLPRWLAPALGLWVVLGTVALANLTPVPLHAAVPAAALAALGLAHGAAHRRWWVAGPVAAVLFAAATVAAAGWLPDGVDLTYRGPAGSTGPKVVWTAVVVVVALEIGWGLVLHARRPPQPAAPVAAPPLEPRLRDLSQRLDRVEHLLTRVD